MGVATAVAIGGLAISAATTTKSFIDAGKQKKLQRQAEADAKKAMDEARKKLDVNYYDQMAVNKEPYELQREALLSQGAQAMQAGVESERGAAATAGRLQQAQNEAQAGIRTEMGKEMADIQKLQLGEESRLRDIGVQLDLGEAEGAQQAARDAQEARAAAMAQGFEGLTNTLQQGLQMVPLFPKTAATKQFGQLEKNYSSAVAASQKPGGQALDAKFLDASGKPLGFQQAMGKMSGYGFDVSGVGAMNPLQFQDYLISQGKNPLRSMAGYNFYAPLPQ